MDSLTLSPPQAEPVTLRLESLQPPEGTEVFFQTHPELLERFDGAFVEDFRTYWLSFAYAHTDLMPSEDVMELEFNDALSREIRFFAKVYGEVETLATQHDGIVTALFDVDHTIREEGDDKVRPGFTLAILELADRFGPKTEVGLLTAIEPRQLDVEHGGPDYLGEVRKLLNPQFIISSIEEHAEAEDGSRRVVKDWGDKNTILLRVADRHPDRLFVYFDNIRSAESINGMNPRVRGVCVAEESHEEIMRLAAA